MYILIYLRKEFIRLRVVTPFQWIFMDLIKVLIADDESDIRQLLEEEVREAFDDTELEFYFAVDGAEAVEIIKSHDLDIILTDLKMPRLDGVSLIQATRELKKEPIMIMITAYGSYENLIDMMRLGVFDFFEKPFDEEQLKATLIRVKNFIQFKRSMYEQITMFLETENVSQETISQVFEFVESISKERYSDLAERLIKKLKGLNLRPS